MAHPFVFGEKSDMTFQYYRITGACLSFNFDTRRSSSASDNTENDKHNRAYNNRRCYQYRTVHKELCWHHIYNLVGIGIEEPIVFAGEEKRVEYNECRIEVKRNKNYKQGKHREQAETRKEADIKAKGTLEVDYALLL